MREIILDTETTGLDPSQGHRVVEIGALELVNHVPTGRTFHAYINPERSVPPEAEAVHGLNTSFLRDKPVFSKVADDFLKFIGDSRLVIHNASFDLSFINAELGSLGKNRITPERAVDTLYLARQKYPLASNSLDALCKRYGIDNSRRSKHGALLDSELLADVYIELIGGRQATLSLTAFGPRTTIELHLDATVAVRPRPLGVRLTAAEIAAHASLVQELGATALWRILG
jgi:DNA polymerase-3 subunit epsilon